VCSSAVLFFLFLSLLGSALLAQILPTFLPTPWASTIARNYFLAVAFMPFVALWLVLDWTQNMSWGWKILPPVFCCSLLFAFFGDGGNILLKSAAIAPTSSFSYYAIAAWIGGIVLLFRQMSRKKREKNFPDFNRSRYLLVSWALSGLAILDFIPALGIGGSLPWAALGAAFWLTLAAYAIAPLRMFSGILWLSQKFLVLGCVVVGYAAVGFGVDTILKLVQSQSSWPIELWGLTTLVATGLVFLKEALVQSQVLVNRTIFDSFPAQDKRLSDLSNSIMLAKSESEFDRILLENVHAAVKPVRAHLFFWNEIEQQFKLRANLFWVKFWPDY
jgi:hypothetical protein